MKRIERAARLWRTARHLRGAQIFGRLRYRFARPTLDLAPTPPTRQVEGPWVQPAARVKSLVGPSRFHLLNRDEELDDVGWDDPRLPKLWRYNQHYFDDLNADGWHARSAWHQGLVARWICDNQAGRGTGWEPYPTSLRIVNWIKWSLSGGVLTPEAHRSLAVQSRWLRQRLEWHLLGNHLFANAKALIFSGLYFEGPEAERWRRQGIDILADELDEQFLGDGGQFELSTMYHALGLEDLLDLINIGNAYPQAFPECLGQRLREKADAAWAWLNAMSHPDGRISFFNDAAFGVAPENADLRNYALQLGLTPAEEADPLIHLKASGYARLSAGPADLFVDLARVGPDYLPGHAHADTLTFELSLHGQRVFVNSGTSEYEPGSQRLRERGTAAHNTAVLGGCDSSEVWGAFRVGRRASVRNEVVLQAGETLIAEGSHDGYAHLAEGGEHHRRLTLQPNGLHIEDSVSGSLHAEAYYHLHPAIEIAAAAGPDVHLVLPGGQQVVFSSVGGSPRIEQNGWHPEFGKREPSRRLIVPFSAGRAAVHMHWGELNC